MQPATTAGQGKTHTNEAQCRTGRHLEHYFSRLVGLGEEGTQDKQPYSSHLGGTANNALLQNAFADRFGIFTGPMRRGLFYDCPEIPCSSAPVLAATRSLMAR